MRLSHALKVPSAISRSSFAISHIVIATLRSNVRMMKLYSENLATASNPHIFPRCDPALSSWRWLIFSRGDSNRSANKWKCCGRFFPHALMHSQTSQLLFPNDVADLRKYFSLPTCPFMISSMLVIFSQSRSHLSHGSTSLRVIYHANGWDLRLLVGVICRLRGIQWRDDKTNLVDIWSRAWVLFPICRETALRWLYRMIERVVNPMCDVVSGDACQSQIASDRWLS